MLAQKLMLGYGSKLLAQFIQIVASIIVARVAGPSVLGTVSFGLAFVTMFRFLGDLGTGTAHVKLISEGQDLGNCISTYSRIKTALTAFFFVTVLSVFLAQKYVFKIEYESPSHEYVILFFLLAIVIDQLLLIPKTTFMGKTEQAKIDIPDFIKLLIHQLLRLIIVLLGYKAVALALGNLIAVILIIPVIYYLFKDYPKGKFDKDLARKYIKISLPVLTIGMSVTLIGTLDKVALQYFTNSEQVGYYTAGFRIGGLIFMIAGTIGMIFFPLFSRAASNGDLQYIKSKIEKFERISFIFIMPGVIFLSIYSDVIIKLVLGEQYLPSVPIMKIINIAMFLTVLNIPVGNVLAGMGFFSLGAWLNLSNLLLFVSLLFILPNQYFFNLGGPGAAYAILVSNIYLGIVFRVFAKKKCPFLQYRNTLKFSVYGIINFFGFLFFYNHFSSIYGFQFKLVFIPIYFGFTYLSLILLGWIDKEKELETLKVLLNLKKLSRYIKDEINRK